MSITIRITRTNGFGRGKTESFTKCPLTIGTGGSCDMRFDPTWDRTVSALHARLLLEDGTLWVEDNSTQGILLDGHQISGKTALQPGAVLELGKTGPAIKLDWEAAPETGASTYATSTRVNATPMTASQVFSATKSDSVENLPTAKQQSSRRKMFWIGLIAAALLITTITAFSIIHFSKSPDEKLAAIAEEKADAVARVIALFQTEKGNDGFFATAWAVDDHTFATNSHVTEGVKQILEKGGVCYLVINRHPDLKFRVTKAISHPRYGKSELDASGRMMVDGYDVGLLFIEEKAPNKFKIAPTSELRKLGPGYRVAYLGFPSAGIVGAHANFAEATATMQSGIITSVTDFWNCKANYDKALFIQHNMGTAGGSSGSPLFNIKGEVVAINNAGTVGQTLVGHDSATGKDVYETIPSGAMINFAQRVDLLKDIWDKYPKD